MFQIGIYTTINLRLRKKYKLKLKWPNKNIIHAKYLKADFLTFFYATDRPYILLQNNCKYKNKWGWPYNKKALIHLP